MDLDEPANASAAGPTASTSTSTSTHPIQEEAYSNSSKRPTSLNLSLKEGDPFDLDAYVSPYTDRRRIERLLYVARNTVGPIRVQAYTSTLETIKKSSLDYRLYADVGVECREVLGASASASASASAPAIDHDWVDEARVKQESGLDKLDVELKNYQNNLIKESIRMGYRDMGDFQRKSGDLSGAIRSYTKSRDYCATSQQILDMCLSVIDTALDQCAYATVRNYVMKAEAALAALGGTKPTGLSGSETTRPLESTRSVNLPGMLASNQPGRREGEARTKSFQLLAEKLAIANAVASLGLGDFQKAARGFLNVSPPPPSSPSSSNPNTASKTRESALSNTSHYISPADIGVYGVLCGMATLDRAAFKRMILDNASFRPYLEHNPFLKDVILKYYNSKFFHTLEILDQNSSRLLLDIHLSRHVKTLVDRIKAKMLVLYFQPFKAVKLDKMAQSFGWDEAALEEELIKLIQSDQMKARLDKQEGTVVAHTPDTRDVLYKRVLKTAKDNDHSNKAMTWRMKLIQNDLIVNVKKDSTAPPPPQPEQPQQEETQQPSTGSSSKVTRSATSKQTVPASTAEDTEIGIESE